MFTIGKVVSHLPLTASEPNSKSFTDGCYSLPVFLMEWSHYTKMWEFVPLALMLAVILSQVLLLASFFFFFSSSHEKNASNIFYSHSLESPIFCVPHFSYVRLKLKFSYGWLKTLNYMTKSNSNCTVLSISWNSILWVQRINE